MNEAPRDTRLPDISGVAICASLPGMVAAAFALGVTVVIGSLVWLTGTGQSAQRAHCPPARVAVVKRFDDVVVYQRPPASRDQAASINVCQRATRRSTRLTYEGYYEDFGGRRALAARGRLVAWVQISRDDGADGDVAVLASGRATSTRRPMRWSSPRARTGTRYGCVPSGAYCISAAAVSQIVIAADGTVVWIACDTEGGMLCFVHHSVLTLHGCRACFRADRSQLPGRESSTLGRCAPRWSS